MMDNAVIGLNRNTPTMAEILTLQEEVAKLPQVIYPVFHHFSEHVYVREFHMPAGHFVIGKEHKTRHLNTVVKGKCTVWTVHGRMELDATNGPRTFESMAGTKKVVWAHTDIVWMTMHATDETDQDRLEGEIIRSTEQLDLFPDLAQLYLGGK